MQNSYYVIMNLQKFFISLLAIGCMSFNNSNYTISVIGDSQVGNVAPHLAKKINTGWVLNYNYKIGSGIQYWNNETFSRALDELQPNEIIIFLGSNNYDAKDLPKTDKIISYIERRKLKCMWVGPPLIFERKWKHTETLQGRIGNVCQYFDSQRKEITLADKIHPTRNGAIWWADAIWRNKK